MDTVPHVEHHTFNGPRSSQRKDIYKLCLLKHPGSTSIPAHSINIDAVDMIRQIHDAYYKGTYFRYDVLLDYPALLAMRIASLLLLMISGYRGIMLVIPTATMFFHDIPGLIIVTIGNAPSIGLMIFATSLAFLMQVIYVVLYFSVYMFGKSEGTSVFTASIIIGTFSSGLIALYAWMFFCFVNYTDGYFKYVEAISCLGLIHRSNFGADSTEYMSAIGSNLASVNATFTNTPQKLSHEHDQIPISPTFSVRRCITWLFGGARGKKMQEMDHGYSSGTIEENSSTRNTPLPSDGHLTKQE